MPPEPVPMPLSDPIARPRRQGLRPGERDPLEGLLTLPWVNFMTDREDAITAAPRRLSVVTLTGQGASIGATDIPTQSLGAGLYRITYYARITRPATTSSSLTVTFGWTESGVSLSQSGAAMTGNTTTTQQNGSLLVLSDDASPITYATTYASVGGTSMQYRLSIVLEKVNA